MRKILVFACVFALTGCAWLGLGDDSETAAQPEAAAESAAPETMAETPAVEVEQEAPAKKPAKAVKKGAKSAKSEDQIKAELDATGKKLASQSARTIVPNKANPQYKQAGGEWIATFITVDPNSVTTEMKPGKAGYVGVIRYQEKTMECRGKTKEAAVNGTCTQIKTRNLSELIHYDGKAWQD